MVASSLWSSIQYLQRPELINAINWNCNVLMFWRSDALTRLYHLGGTVLHTLAADWRKTLVLGEVAESKMEVFSIYLLNMYRRARKGESATVSVS